MKRYALDLLDLSRAQRVLDVGVGPGGELVAIRSRLLATASLVALDLSGKMLRRARRSGGNALVQGSATDLPFREAAFDRLFAAYVLDLLPGPLVGRALDEFRRVLRGEGRAVIVAMTEGVSLSSRLVIAAWKALYAVSPKVCGGCRPLQLGSLAERVGFKVLHREVVVEWGFPSEVVLLGGNRLLP